MLLQTGHSHIQEPWGYYSALRRATVCGVKEVRLYITCFEPCSNELSAGHWAERIEYYLSYLRRFEECQLQELTQFELQLLFPQSQPVQLSHWRW